jgi:NtrC-family two-component system response regulator AlgB
VELLPVTLFVKQPSVSLGDPFSLAVIEEQHIRRILASTTSLQKAAELLGIDQATLWRKRKQYKI